MIPAYGVRVFSVLPFPLDLDPNGQKDRQKKDRANAALCPYVELEFSYIESGEDGKLTLRIPFEIGVEICLKAPSPYTFH